MRTLPSTSKSGSFPVGLNPAAKAKEGRQSDWLGAVRCVIRELEFSKYKSTFDAMNKREVSVVMV